ncbi:MAG: SDR family oxidoreductase [Leptospiraceae bacterium]|nr:SDR family oxidoreductase [Leptospiraceae bacterium]MCP5498424.1 SDR family oxidoreductase [Leptospiraceae bacterium]
MKVALVSGANRGIGKEVCRQLTQIGYNTILTARNEEAGKETAKELGIPFFPLDIRSESSINRLRDYLQKGPGKLDVLINNAGIYRDDDNSLLNTSIETIQLSLETNFFGALRLIKSLISLIPKSTKSRIINVSSGMGALHDMGSGSAGYRISKTALNAMSLLLAHELPEGPGVFSVCPGWVKTDMGGSSAPRTIEQGAETIVWLASTDPSPPSGKFYRDKKEIPW